MNVTLVFPGITEVGFRSYGEEPNSSWHSHGLCSISSCLKKAGHAVSLVDLRTLTGWEEYQQRIAELAPGVLCISMMSCSFNPALRCAELAHHILPSVKTVVGGPHPSVLPEDVEQYPDFDYIVRGEGEISLVELIAAMEKGLDIPRITIGKPPDLDTLPYADRELFGPHEISHPIEGFSPPFMTFIAGRGCRFNCAFCQPAERKIFGGKVRRRSPENFIGELLECKARYGFSSYAIHDDCLIEDIAWVEKFCSLLEDHGIGIPFSCQGRADLICRHPETLRQMKKVGLAMICVGFESGSNRVLKFLRKGVRVEQNLEAGRILKEIGIKIWANYMLGIPTETLEEMQDTVKMIKSLRPDHFSPSIYTPHPGSDMYNYCMENNLLLSHSHDSFRHTITEVKIKGQDWHAIEWAVGESMSCEPDIIPYSKDYVSSWGEISNLAGKENWEEKLSSLPRLELQNPEVCNLEKMNGTKWRSTTSDPQFIWHFPQTLYPLSWRYIVIDLESTCTGRAHLYWWIKEYTKFQATKHFRVYYGRNTYIFDLTALKTYRKMVGDDIRWDDSPIQMFRFDPCERSGVELTLHSVQLFGRE